MKKTIETIGVFYSTPIITSECKPNVTYKPDFIEIQYISPIRNNIAYVNKSTKKAQVLSKNDYITISYKTPITDTSISTIEATTKAIIQKTMNSIVNISIAYNSPITNNKINVLSSTLKAKHFKLNNNIIYTLRFNKVFYSNIDYYKLIVKYKNEYNNDQLKTILKITKSTPTKIIKKEKKINIINNCINLNDYKINNIYTNQNYDIELYDNNKKISLKYYSFNKTTNTIKFNSLFKYNSNNIYKFVYYIKQIEFKYTSNKICSFYIEPVYKNKHLLGNHNILL